MLLPYTTLTYFGPGAGAGYGDGVGSAAADIKAWGEPSATVSGVASAPLAQATRLVNRPGTASGVGSATASTLARARIAGIVKVNELSQDDVTGAVLEAKVDGDVSLKQALRLITAALAGKVSGAGTSTVTIRDVNDTKARITATVDANGNRSAITTDTTD